MLQPLLETLFANRHWLVAWKDPQLPLPRPSIRRATLLTLHHELSQITAMNSGPIMATGTGKAVSFVRVAWLVALSADADGLHGHWLTVQKPPGERQGFLFSTPVGHRCQR